MSYKTQQSWPVLTFERANQHNIRLGRIQRPRLAAGYLSIGMVSVVITTSTFLRRLEVYFLTRHNTLQHKQDATQDCQADLMVLLMGVH